MGTPSSSSAHRVRRRRDKLRAEGLRPVQLWAPDTRDQDVVRECARQAATIRASETGQDAALDEAWAAVADAGGWTA
ncbi:antitoxin MazE-like protein [Caulobacter sp. S45]|uniref:antitoxin MazE-like protein n=1 Tax=Caulobacter sp. S45 TaxID=1641861 RepID=UPI0015755A79|nr:antitoxin MazE-like protein [Caulobacter sp. S45]